MKLLSNESLHPTVTARVVRAGVGYSGASVAFLAGVPVAAGDLGFSAGTTLQSQPARPASVDNALPEPDLPLLVEKPQRAIPRLRPRRG